MIDALAIGAAGHHDVTSIHDCERDLEELCRLIDARAVRQVVLAIRRGDESELAIARVRKRLAATGLCVCDALIDATTSGDELARTLGDARERLRERHTTIASAVTVASRDAEPSEPSAVAPAAGNDDELVFVFDDRRWRIRGLATNKARGTLRVNVLVSRDLGQVLLALEQAHDELLRRTLEPTSTAPVIAVREQLGDRVASA